MKRSEKWKVESEKQLWESGGRGRPPSQNCARSKTPQLFTSNFSLLTFSKGFSLLELVAAMTILVAVISILGRIVTDTQRAWRQGADAAELSLNARAAFAMLDADLSASVASSNLVFELTDEIEGSLHGTNVATSLLFYRLMPASASPGTRSLQQVHVFATPPVDGAYQSLFRERRPVLFEEPYPGELESWTSTNIANQVILENIVALRVHATYPAEIDEGAAEASDPFVTALSYNSDDHANRLPAMIDVEVALLPHRLAERLRTASDEARRLQATWFSHRIHCRNREGGYLP